MLTGRIGSFVFQTLLQLCCFVFCAQDGGAQEYRTQSYPRMFRSKRESSSAMEGTAKHKGITMGTTVKMVERLGQGKTMVFIDHSSYVCVSYFYALCCIQYLCERYIGLTW